MTTRTVVETEENPRAVMKSAKKLGSLSPTAMEKMNKMEKNARISSLNPALAAVSLLYSVRCVVLVMCHSW